MRYFIAGVLALFITTNNANATGSVDTMYKFGVNWQGFDDSLAGGHLKSVCIGLGFNVFHGFYNDGARDNAPAWNAADGGTNTKMIVDMEGGRHPAVFRPRRLARGRRVYEIYCRAEPSPQMSGKQFPSP